MSMPISNEPNFCIVQKTDQNALKGILWMTAGNCLTFSALTTTAGAACMVTATAVNMLAQVQ